MFRLMLFSLVSSAIFLTAAPQPQPFRRPLVFEPNRGQASAQVNWIARGSGYQLFLTSEGATMMIDEAAAEPFGSNTHASSRQLTGLKPRSVPGTYSTLQLKLIGSRPWNNVTGLEPTGGVSNYLQGRDARNSFTHIPHYARVSAIGVYDGIDLVFYSRGGDLEYDFVVAPGADPGKIRLAFEGQERIRVDAKSGDLVLVMAGGSELRQVHPKVYQQIGERRVEIAGSYELLDHGRAAFKLEAYDRRLPLVIDPTVSFTAFFGGTSADYARAVAVDSDGNTYVTGATSSQNFPVSNNSKWLNCHHDFLGFCVPASNIFIAKLSPTGTILFSSYGGVGGGNAIAIDSTGVYVTGAILEPDIDNVIGFGGGSDLFIWKLSFNGDAIYGNGFHDSADEYGNAIAVDSQHNAWVAGGTNSPEFLAPNRKATAVLIGKFGPTGQELAYGTSASQGDSVAYGITVDPNDQPWITGQACGPGFPTTGGVFDATANCHVFVMQLERGTGATRMSMVLGGSDKGDAGTGIVSNGSNAAYVTGYTYSASFPTTVEGFQTARASTGPQAFVTEIDSSTFVGHIVHSTLLGADGDTLGRAIASDSGGGVFVTGSTSASHFPGAPALTPNPTAGFVSKFSYNLSQLQYTKLLGAEVDGLAIRRPSAPPSVPELYTVGFRYTGSVNPSNIDAFEVKLTDDVAQSQVLWHNPATGDLSAWLLDDQGHVTDIQSLSRKCGASDGCSQNWKVIGTLDFDRDGIGDVLLHNATTGEVQAWLLNSSGVVTGSQTISRRCGTYDGCSPTWKPLGVGDFNHDGMEDILWHNDKTGELQAWLLNGAGEVTSTLSLSKRCGTSDGCWPEWQIIAIGDFNDDGIDDLFWYDTKTGKVDIGFLNNSGGVTGSQWLAKVCGPSDGCSTAWKPVGLADVNLDGIGDLLWENPTTGELSAWLLNGTDRILGTQSVLLRCDSASGCSQGSIPVGILRDHANPQ